MPLYINFPEWISPVIVPGLPFRWYGMMYLVAFGLAYLFTRIQLKEPDNPLYKKVTDDEVINLFFWIIIGLLIGSRVVATTVYDTSGRYLQRPWLMFWPFDENMNFTGLQGMSFHGGLFGGIIAGIIYSRVRKIDIPAMADVIITSVPFGYTFGRIGNFINGELYGRITDSSVGILFPQAEPVPTSHPAVREIAANVGIDITGLSMVNLPRHPSQLYEAALEGLVLWAVMWFFFRHRKPFRGFMLGVYLVGYSIARFIAEYFRQPDPGLDFIIQWGPRNNPRWLLLSPWNFTTGQVLSLITAAVGVVTILIIRRIVGKKAQVETFEPSR
ncbi:MAG: prolipoprotein diacylglyceryl transferase [Alkalispirochaeta sp.]|jgi:phosphatidylglycerol:prolipoprotein diacylglycerol transferase